MFLGLASYKHLTLTGETISTGVVFYGPSRTNGLRLVYHVLS